MNSNNNWTYGMNATLYAHWEEIPDTFLSQSVGLCGISALTLLISAHSLD